jgi:radical SAM protein with 4Fe4S-binding SPASM domain
MSLENGFFKKAYFEITNVCNANCSFCPKNSRPKYYVTDSEFERTTDELKGQVEYLYFHLMGEPFLHPDIESFALKAKAKGFKVMITTNGILSDKIGIPLVRTGAIDKISISLHSYESNLYSFSLEDYLNRCVSLADVCADYNTVCAFRLWNAGYNNSLNDTIISFLHRHYTDEWSQIRTGFKIKNYIFLEWGEHFEWPDTEADRVSDKLFCYGLRNQIGILSDGTVVPCCLDSEGKIPLGNIYTQSLKDILSSERAKRIYDGFSQHKPVEELCKRCGYATRFV